MDIETAWWSAFGDSYGIEFERARPDYQTLDKATQLIGALMKLELDMYNGGYLQFFCNCLAGVRQDSPQSLTKGTAGSNTAPPGARTVPGSSMW